MAPETTDQDRQYASELLADLASPDLPRLEIAARWFRKARLENALLGAPRREIAAPADDAAVAWRVRVREGSTVYHIYTERLPFEPDADSLVVAISDPVPVYLRPAKVVDVEAVAHIIDPDAKFEDFDGIRWSKFEIQRRELARGKAREIAALLRDSNASSDKGGR